MYEQFREPEERFSVSLNWVNASLDIVSVNRREEIENRVIGGIILSNEADSQLKTTLLNESADLVRQLQSGETFVRFPRVTLRIGRLRWQMITPF